MAPTKKSPTAPARGRSKAPRAGVVGGEPADVFETSPAPSAAPMPPLPTPTPRIIYAPEDRASMHAVLCEQIANGMTIYEALREVVLDEETGRHLAWSTVCRWHGMDATLAANFARARQDSADMWASRAVDEAMTAYDPQVGRLRYDAAKWKAGVSKPRVYGNKVDVTSDGEALSPIVALPASVLIQPKRVGPGA